MTDGNHFSWEFHLKFNLQVKLSEKKLFLPWLLTTTTHPYSQSRATTYYSNQISQMIFLPLNSITCIRNNTLNLFNYN